MGKVRENDRKMGKRVGEGGKWGSGKRATACILQHLKPCWSHAFGTGMVRVSPSALQENI